MADACCAVSGAIPPVPATGRTANALRYAPTGTPPLLAAERRGGWVELRVADRGPGVRAADRELMFAPFRRLGETDSATGVGLGLAVSRGLTEVMGGTLQPGETPGGGMTMTISLPAALPAESAGRGCSDE
jgi:two-component system, OmpR family, sensor histidine kinase KdpD